MQAVLAQSYPNWVHIIVNDGGEPQPVDMLVAGTAGEYKDRARVVHNPMSMGMEVASNIGIRESDGELITLLDDDDSWHPEFLARCVTALEKKKTPSIRGVVTQSMRVMETIETTHLGEAVRELRREPFNPRLARVEMRELLAANLFTVNSFVYERDALHDTGLYREDLPVLGDWEFNIRFLCNFDIDVIPYPLTYFHHRHDVKTGTLANTVIAGRQQHLFYASLLRNELLRQDLRSGRSGLGTLMMIATELNETRTGAARPKRSSILRRVLRMLRNLRR
jgi:glycosyltransferase involved in cell wall biosynthesis